MKKIKTKYIKERIKNLSFRNIEDRKYIKDLLYIERLLSSHPRTWGFAGAMDLGFKKETYPEEYNAIHKELDPKGFEKVEENEKGFNKEREELRKKLRKGENEELDAFEKEWIKAGGKR